VTPSPPRDSIAASIPRRSELISFRRGDRYGDIERDNDGDVVALVSDGQGHIDAWQVGSDSRLVEDAVSKISLHCPDEGVREWRGGLDPHTDLELRRHLIPKLLEDGEELPEPADEKEPIEQYSGNLVLRIPKRLHARLASEARRSGCSINKLATELLSQSLERSVLLREMHRLLEEKEPQTAPLNSSSPKGTTQAARPKGVETAKSQPARR
jgi:HicB-like protein involved in pilus formation